MGYKVLKATDFIDTYFAIAIPGADMTCLPDQSCLSCSCQIYFLNRSFLFVISVNKPTAYEYCLFCFKT